MIPVDNSYLYDKALSKEEVHHEMHIFSNGDNGMTSGDYRLSSKMDPWIELADRFVKNVM